jgi:hypothetical protein
MIDLTADAGRLAILSSDRWMHAAHAERFREGSLRKVRIDRVEKVDAARGLRYPGLHLSRHRHPDPGGPMPPPPRRRRWQVADKTLSAIVEGWMARFPSIEQAGCEIRVGPALGHEAAFVGRALDVEEALLMPYLRAREIVGDGLAWEGDRVISVHAPGGGLIDLRRYPRAAAHLGASGSGSKDAPASKGTTSAGQWYRTIDRVDPALWASDKILLPEIFRVPRIAVDQGGHVPAHGIYAIFSASWPLPDPARPAGIAACSAQ